MSRRVLMILCLMFLISGLVLAEEPEYGGMMIMTEIGEWGEMFNPILNEAGSDGDINDLIYDGLVSYNSNLEIVPRVAESFEISPDGLTYTFYLRQGVKFHDGHELTSEDVAYTFTSMVHPDYTGVRSGQVISIKGARDFREGKADSVAGINILDDYKISFTIEETDAAFLGNLTYGILPAHLLKNIPVGELESAQFNRQPIGCGPFKFSEYVSQQYFIAEANEDYYLGRPYLDKVMIRVVAQSSIPMLLEKREIDFTGVPAEHFKKVKALPHVNGYTGARFQLLYMGVNQTRPLFSDKRVKQALLYAFNREVMVNGLFRGYGEVAHSVMPTVSWAYKPDLQQYNFNQIIARQLLEEAGFDQFDKDGTRINSAGQRLEIEFLAYQENNTIVNVTEMFQQMMKLIGVKVNITRLEFNALLDRVYDPEGWHYYIMYWQLTPEPDWSFALRSDAAWNDVFFVNEESDALLDTARKELDQEKRKQLYYDWQELAMEELPYYPLMFPQATTCVDVRIKGYNTNSGPLGLLWGEEGYIMHKVWIPADQRIRSTE